MGFDKTNNSKLYKNNICEKSLKHRFNLKKHKTKSHDLNNSLSFVITFWNIWFNVLN